MNKGSRKILIIDDEAVFREDFQNNLTRCGYECRSAENSSDGLNMIKSNRYDLILLDIMMEPFDGWETLDSIRDLRQVYKPPIIMASAKLISADEILRYGDRISGFIRKPIERDELCELISSFFTWQEGRQIYAEKLMAHGASASLARKVTTLSRQIRVLPDLMESMSPWCLPDEGLSEEECMEKRKKDIQSLIIDKKKQLDDLLTPYSQI